MESYLHASEKGFYKKVLFKNIFYFLITLLPLYGVHGEPWI